MRILHKILSALSAPVAVAGVVVFFATDLNYVVYACAVTLLIYSLLNCIYGGQNNLVTEFLTFIIGSLVSWIFKIEYFPCIAVSFCISELLFSGLGWIAVLLAFIKSISDGKRE